MERDGIDKFRSPFLCFDGEVNLAVLDRELAAVIEGDFAEDLKQADR